jgi:hypothetical protein
LFWLHHRCEGIFNEMHRLFLGKPNATKFTAMALESYTKYESTKALAGITLSSKIFDRLNPKLSTEWKTLCQKLGI